MVFDKLWWTFCLESDGKQSGAHIKNLQQPSLKPPINTPGSMNSLFSDCFKKFGGVILEVFGTIWGIFGRNLGGNNPGTFRGNPFKIILNCLFNDLGVFVSTLEPKFLLIHSGYTSMCLETFDLLIKTVKHNINVRSDANRR